MYTLIAIFYASLVGSIMMVFLKHREMQTGNATIVSHWGKGIDHVFHDLFARVRRGISYMNRRTFIIIGQLVAFHVLLRMRNVYVDIKHRTLANPHGRKVLDAVRGRGEVKKHGASLYLRRLSSRGK